MSAFPVESLSCFLLFFGVFERFFWCFFWCFYLVFLFGVFEAKIIAVLNWKSHIQNKVPLPVVYGPQPVVLCRSPLPRRGRTIVLFAVCLVPTRQCPHLLKIELRWKQKKKQVGPLGCVFGHGVSLLPAACLGQSREKISAPCWPYGVKDRLGKSFTDATSSGG